MLGVDPPNPRLPRNPFSRLPLLLTLPLTLPSILPSIVLSLVSGDPRRGCSACLIRGGIGDIFPAGRIGTPARSATPMQRMIVSPARTVTWHPKKV